MPVATLKESTDLRNFLKQITTVLTKNMHITGMAVAFESEEGISTHQFGIESASMAKISLLFKAYSEGDYSHFIEQ